MMGQGFGILAGCRERNRKIVAGQATIGVFSDCFIQKNGGIGRPVLQYVNDSHDVKRIEISRFGLNGLGKQRLCFGQIAALDVFDRLTNGIVCSGTHCRQL